MRRRLLRFCLGPILAALLVGPAMISTDASAQQALPPGEVGPGARILPGDQVSLRILREPEMSGVFTVADEGYVLLPRLGQVRVDQHTAGNLQDSLRVAYARYLREPAVEVTVLRRIGVHGEVRKPDLYLVDLTLTLRDVLAKAGGITEAGDPGKITVVRDGETLPLGQRPAQEVLASQLRSGDQIVVGRRSWLALNPNVAVGMFSGLVATFISILTLVR